MVRGEESSGEGLTIRFNFPPQHFLNELGIFFRYRRVRIACIDGRAAIR